jgi:integrase
LSLFFGEGEKMPKLTKTVVEAAKPRERQYTVWCSDLPGFGVYILPTGKRSYFVDYRNADGVRRRMTLGRHGSLTADEARKLAIQALAGKDKGEDPALDRKTRRSAQKTVAELCEDYLSAAEKGLILGKKARAKKTSTLATDRGRIKRHIIPLLGKKAVKDVGRADIIRFIEDVTAGKTAVVEKTDKLRGKAVVEGGRGTAARTAGLLGGILTYAVDKGIIDRSPAEGVKKPAYSKRQRRLMPDEFEKLGAALRLAESDGECWQGIAGIRLLALTGCRLQEISKLQWTEVQPSSGCIQLKDSKEGASVRPAGKAAFDALECLERRKGNEYVLPAIRAAKGHYGGIDGAIERIMERAGLPGVTAHTLRHSFASVAGDLGFSEPTIGAMLGQASGTVTRQYIHHLDSVLIAAADKVAATINNYMNGEPQGASEAKRSKHDLAHCKHVPP